jgi:hypothetical protein
MIMSLTHLNVGDIGITVDDYNIHHYWLIITKSEFELTLFELRQCILHRFVYQFYFEDAILAK